MATILYHGGCFDGFGAAWAAWKALGDSPTTTYRPVFYGKPMPSFPDGDDVWILDFSYPRVDLEKRRKVCQSLTVIDHHKTAEADLADLPYAHFDMTRSGAVLAWEHFHPGTAVPTLLRYVQDRDLWQWALPDSHAINAWIESYPKDFGWWSTMAEKVEAMGPRSMIVDLGEGILRMKRQKVQEIADNSYWQVWPPYGRIPIVNTACFMSEVAAELLDRWPTAKFAAYWFHRQDGQEQWGLRSRKDFDCSAVAKDYGGGGHAQASGFVVQTGLAKGWEAK